MKRRVNAYPQPPLPRQHQESPGLESEVSPRPKFEAPAYRAAGKLQGKVKTNIYGYFYMVKAALPHLKEGSCIINTGSITGFEGQKTLLDYASTKGAIHAFTKSLAQNLIEKKIRVNGVAPGPVWTPLNPVASTREKITKFGADTPMGRPGQPEEMAPTYVFLASNADSGYITGEIVALLGGDVTGG